MVVVLLAGPVSSRLVWHLQSDEAWRALTLSLYKTI